MQKHGLSLLFLFIAVMFLSTPWAASEQQPDAAPIPAYHPAPPLKADKLPAIFSKDQLWGENAQYPYQTHAYELAAKIEGVLYQQPCYCYCDRMGHQSLHSCFEGTHGAECSICMKELYYAYAQHKNKKTARQIRQGIMAGEWKQVDLHDAATMN